MNVRTVAPTAIRTAVTARRVTSVTPSWLTLDPFLEERHQWRQRPLRRFHVRHVAEAGQEQQLALAVRDGVDDVLHPLLEDRRRPREHVLIAAERQRRRL